MRVAGLVMAVRLPSVVFGIGGGRRQLSVASVVVGSSELDRPLPGRFDGG
jgi:hypothetical protein